VVGEKEGVGERYNNLWLVGLAPRGGGRGGGKKRWCF